MEKSQYSQTMGSFIRNYSYPLEADYEFSNKEELEQWALDNKNILHNGLLKIVKEPDKQTLYWSYNENVDEENPDFKFYPLIDSNSFENFELVKQVLEDNDLIKNLMKELERKVRDKIKSLQEELDRTQVGVGLNGDGSFDKMNMQNTIYLKGAWSIIECIKELDRQFSKLKTYIEEVEYDKEAKIIYFKNGDEVISQIDVTEFIKDGMVKNVTIEDNNLVITFNTDAGITPISIPLSEIFNPEDYYDKNTVDFLLNDKLDSSELENLASKQWVENKNYLTEHQDISNLATKDEVKEATDQLENYLTKSEASETYQPVGEYLTEHQSLDDYYTKEEIDEKIPEEVDMSLYVKKDQILQSLGDSETDVMSQKIVSDEIKIIKTETSELIDFNKLLLKAEPLVEGLQINPTENIVTVTTKILNTDHIKEPYDADFIIPAATQDKAGVMTFIDKVKLDNIPENIATKEDLEGVVKGFNVYDNISDGYCSPPPNEYGYFNIKSENNSGIILTAGETRYGEGILISADTDYLATKEDIQELQEKVDNTPQLDNGIIPSTYLPSYVDDVIDFIKEVSGSNWEDQIINTTELGDIVWNAASSTNAGEYYHKFIKNTDGTIRGLQSIDPESGKIYINNTNNNTYRWSGSNLIEISKSLAIGETSSTAYAGNKGKELADKLATIEEGAQKNVPAFEGVRIDGMNGTAASSTIKSINFITNNGIRITKKIPSSTFPSTVVFDSVNIDIGLTADYTKGVADGIASLDSEGKIPENQLPDKKILIIHDTVNTGSGYGISDEDAYLLKENLQAFKERKLLLYTTFNTHYIVRINYFTTDSGNNIYGVGYFIDNDKKLYELDLSIRDYERPTITATVIGLQDFKYSPTLCIQNNASINGQNPGFIINLTDANQLKYYKNQILSGKTSLIIKDVPSGAIIKPIEFNVDSSNNYVFTLIHTYGNGTDLLIVTLPEGETQATVTRKELISFV